MTTSLFKAQESVADLFFNNRFNDMLDRLLESYLDSCLDASRLPHHVEMLKNTSALLEEIMYVRQGDPVVLAIAQELILNYLRDTLRGMRRAVTAPKRTEPASVRAPAPEIQKIVVEATPAPRPKEINQGASRQKILEFVRKAPERRAKDIIDEFSALSERTVKRGLKELSEEGLIIKKSENRAVYYSAV